ncbi:MAG: HAD family hydrolase [bacterium]|nr:HAD family hydrolase [bacterium]
MSDIKLLVIDLDGTMLGGGNPYHRIKGVFVDFLDELGQQGILWATNTTWGLSEQLSLILNSTVRTMPSFISGSTGRVLARIEAEEIVPDTDYNAVICDKDRNFRERHWPVIRPVLHGLLEEDLVEELSFDSQNMLSLLFRISDNAMICKSLELLLSDGRFYRANSGKGRKVTLLPVYMNKGDVVRAMQDRLGIGPEHTIVAGDGENDMSMFRLEIARHMVCPSNACDRIKDAVASTAGVVGSTPYAEGIIDAVRRLLIRQVP